MVSDVPSYINDHREKRVWREVRNEEREGEKTECSPSKYEVTVNLHTNKQDKWHMRRNESLILLINLVEISWIKY